VANIVSKPKARERLKKIRILIADDHPIFRDGLRKLLSLEEDFQVIGEAEDGKEAVDMVQKLSPDILLLDLKMPNLSGIGALEALGDKFKSTRVIVLTASEDEAAVVQAMRMGTAGIVLKQTATDLLIKSIRKVYDGEIWLDSRMTTAVMKEFSQPAPVREPIKTVLSTREREVVALVCQGFRNKEIAEKMFISEQTVKNHLHNIFDKLGVSDRLELALFAIHKKLNEPPA
jgi:two-component system, NarL family, nitrate/nitrite response regulator NarL